MPRSKAVSTGATPAERRSAARKAIIDAPLKARLAKRVIRKSATAKRHAVKKTAAKRSAAGKLKRRSALAAGDFGPTKAGGTRKNAPGQGRKPTDARGNTKPYQIHLVPEQMATLKEIAEAEGFKNVSQLLGSWADANGQ